MAFAYPPLSFSIPCCSFWSCGTATGPQTGLVTGLFVLLFRTLTDLFSAVPLIQALGDRIPWRGILSVLRCAAVPAAVRPALGLLSPAVACHSGVRRVSNIVNLALSSHGLNLSADMLAALLWLAFGRSMAALTILFVSRSYRLLILREEHEQRYQHLFLMTADLKTELYFLKKDAEDIEAVMSSAYQLYEHLEAQHADESLTALALSIARDVHEVKKDNLRIIRGIEEEVAGDFDDETMALSDLLHILQVSTRQLLGQLRADIRLECSCDRDLPIREHYRLLSVLKNLVTNAVEAIQAGPGHGNVQVDCRVQGDDLRLQVTDNGPGISSRAMNLLFQVGYSTKFNPDTGDINRGVGLPAVKYIVDELGGSIQVDSRPGVRTQFDILLPLAAVTGGQA